MRAVFSNSVNQSHVKMVKMKNSSPKTLITINNIKKIKQFYVSIRLVIKTSSLWAVYMGQNFL